MYAHIAPSGCAMIVSFFLLFPLATGIISVLPCFKFDPANSHPNPNFIQTPGHSSNHVGSVIMEIHSSEMTNLKNTIQPADKYRKKS